MEFMDVVEKRYSCKKYDGQPIHTNQLSAILRAGRLAPTAKNLQEQQILVVETAEGLAKVDSVTPCRYGAPNVHVVSYDRTNTFTYPGGKYSSGAEDAAIVATHMILAAADAGVDSCWVNNFDPDKAREVFGLAENVHVLCLIDLGHAAEGAGPLPNHGKRKALEETVKYI